MKRFICLVLACILMAFLLQGCSLGGVAKDKVRDLDYTVVPEEDIPEELKKIIDEKKTQPFQLSYAAGDELYIAIGYGEQKTGGYSIVLDELYVTEDAVVIGTTLMGPSKDEQVQESLSYPYIVVKTEYLDLPVEYLGVENNFNE